MIHDIHGRVLNRILKKLGTVFFKWLRFNHSTRILEAREEMDESIMQTFLPLPTFKASAKVLDRHRLGKQRIECFQILSTLLGKSAGWANHPAVKMWKGYEFALVEYTFVICEEWTLRGYKDTIGTRVVTELLDGVPASSRGGWPPHFDEAFRRSHQSNLLRKDPAHYGPHFPDVPADLPYIWPVPAAK